MYKTADSGERASSKSIRELLSQVSVPVASAVNTLAPSTAEVAIPFASLPEPLAGASPSDQRLHVYCETLSALNREETFEFCYFALQDVINYFKNQHPYLSSAASLVRDRLLHTSVLFTILYCIDVS